MHNIVTSTAAKRGSIVLALFASCIVAALAQGSGDTLTTAYGTAAQSVSDGIKANYVVLMPIIGGLLLIVWGPRLAKDLLKYFTH